MDTDATPVLLDVAPAVAPAVRGWIESIGWQVVEDETVDLVPPALLLTDTLGTVEAAGTPTVLLVQSDDDPVAAAARAGTARPHAVLRWPEDRSALEDLVVPWQSPPSSQARARTLTVSGAAGGVGTTTVALALGGLTAWRGRRTLVVAHGDVPIAGVRTTDADAIRGPGGWRAGTAAPGVPGLRVVGVGGPPPVEVDVPEADAVVLDLGVGTAGDVLVLRRDASGLTALEGSVGGVAIVVDQGPAHPRDVAAAARGRRVVNLPYSTRVARAGLARRVPAGLPGAWLRLLSPVVRDG